MRQWVPPGAFVMVFALVTAAESAAVLVAAGLPGAAFVVALAAVVGLSVYAGRRATVAAISGLAIVVPGLSLATLTAARSAHVPVHDSVLMTEAAAARLALGQDPYGHDYVSSLARTFFIPEVPANFGLAHYVYPPLMVLADVPLRVLARVGPDLSFAWMYLPALVLLVAAVLWLGQSAEERCVLLAAVPLNPLFVFDFLSQINDVFFLAPLIAAVAAARRDRWVWAGALAGVALGMKQEALLLLPYLAVAAVRLRGPAALRQVLVAGALVLAAVLLPFLLWNARALVSDLVGFFYGSGQDNYPIRGLGLAGLFLRTGAIANRWEAFPSALLQVLVSLPLGLALGVWLGRSFTWPRFWVCSALLALSVFLLGRVLAPNYIDLVLILGWLGLASLICPQPSSNRRAALAPTGAQ